jgi:hypothetical protein
MRSSLFLYDRVWKLYIILLLLLYYYYLLKIFYNYLLFLNSSYIYYTRLYCFSFFLGKLARQINLRTDDFYEKAKK